MKVCSTCGEEKDLPCFSKCAKHRDGLGYSCKPCKSKIDREYRDNNKEKLKAQRHEYYLKNKETIIDKTKKYTQENREHLNKCKAANRLKDVARFRGYQNKWAAKNIEAIREKNLAHYYSNKEQYKERANKYRKDPEKMAQRAKTMRAWERENKERIEEWRRERKEKNPELIQRQDREKLKRYREKHREEILAVGRLHVETISDRYVKNILLRSGVKNPPQELIELKRIQLKIHRALK